MKLTAEKISVTVRTAGNDYSQLSDLLNDAREHVAQARSVMRKAERLASSVSVGYNMTGNIRAYVTGHLEQIEVKIDEYLNTIEEYSAGPTEEDSE